MEPVRKAKQVVQYYHVPHFHDRRNAYVICELLTYPSIRCRVSNLAPVMNFVSTDGGMGMRMLELEVVEMSRSFVREEGGCGVGSMVVWKFAGGEGESSQKVVGEKGILRDMCVVAAASS